MVDAIELPVCVKVVLTSNFRRSRKKTGSMSSVQLCHGAVGYKEIKEKPVMPVVTSPWLSHAQRGVAGQVCAGAIVPAERPHAEGDVMRTGKSPYISVRIQELYDVNQTPKIAMGRVPVTVHILTPGMKPIQVTQDLASFLARTLSAKIKVRTGAAVSEAPCGGEFLATDGYR